MKACPKCNSTSRYKMRRTGIVRLIPGTQSYACDNCNTRYTYYTIINRSFRDLRY